MTALERRIARRALGGRREHDGRRGDREVGAVVLADAEHVEPDLVGELDLLDQVAQPLRRSSRSSRRRSPGVTSANV